MLYRTPFKLQQMSCIDNIVSLGLCPDEGPSLSGFNLVDAPGINRQNLAKITDDQADGAQFALSVKRRTLIEVRNDFMQALQINNVIPQIVAPVYATSAFKTAVSTGTYAGYRGVTVHKNKAYRGMLRKNYLKAVQLFPLESGDTTLRIFDGLTTRTYPITVVAGQVNEFSADQLDGFPLEFTEPSIRVTVDQTEIPFASAFIECKAGCGGSMPNPCGVADGWAGMTAVKSEGYGVNVLFYCECDYEQILCHMAKSYIGELVFLRWQINVFQEQLSSNRFNNWIIYNREELQKYTIPDLQNTYNARWNALMNALYGILKTYRDECLNCRGTRWVTNV